MNKRQHGFTMIELIVVIVILGILAAVALPRFSNMQRDARIAKLNAARGAVQSAAGIIHGAALVRAGGSDTVGCPTNLGPGPDPANNTTNVCTETGRVSIVNRYPTANLSGIIDAAGLASTFPVTEADIAAEGYSTTADGTSTGAATGGAAIDSTITIRVTGGTNSATCSFTYTPSTGGTAGSSAVISTVTTAGC